VVFVVAPVVVWLAAFLIWLNWEDVTRLAGARRAPAQNARKDNSAKAGKTAPAAGEKILEEDRKRLDDIR